LVSRSQDSRHEIGIHYANCQFDFRKNSIAESGSNIDISPLAELAGDFEVDETGQQLVFCIPAWARKKEARKERASW
jgi:hypothetical protein